MHFLQPFNLVAILVQVCLQVPCRASVEAVPAEEQSAPGRYVLPLHRQRVPVRSDSGIVSYKSVYFGVITVGAPVKQTFSMVFDTGSGHVIVPSETCKSPTCRIHNRYDRKASLYAVDIDYDGTQVQPGAPRDQITVAFGTGEVTGQFINDRLCLGSVQEPQLGPGGVSGFSGSGASTEPLLALLQATDELKALLGGHRANATQAATDMAVVAAARAAEPPTGDAEAAEAAATAATAASAATTEVVAEPEAPADTAVVAGTAEALAAAAARPPQEASRLVAYQPPEAEPNCVDLRVVMATEMTEEPFHAFAFDGVLGLGLEALALAPEFSFFGMMSRTRHLKHPSFGVFLADSDDEHSEISFGGYSPDHVQSELTWAPVASPDLGYWQVQITGLRIGNRSVDWCDDGLCRAVVDTGTSLLAVPRLFADELQEALEGPLRDPAPTGAEEGVDCRKAEGATLYFELAGMTLSLAPGDYSRQAIQMSDEDLAEGEVSDTPADQASDGRSTQCKPSLMPIELPEPLGPKLFIWGEPVLRKYYTVYDWEEKRIGFGLAIHSPEEPPAPPVATPRKRPLLRL